MRTLRLDQHRLLLSCLTLLGLALRLWQLGEPSLWHDEVLELERASASMATLLFGRPIDQDPPLAALLWRGWIEIGGGPGASLAISEWWLRLPSALAGAVTVALVGAWSGRRFGPRIGALTALLIAIAPVMVHYGQELNQYAVTPLLMLAILIGWEHVVDRGRSFDWRVYGAVCAISLLTHYGMVFPVMATSIDLGWRIGRESERLDRGQLFRHAALLGAVIALLAGLGLFERASTPHLDPRLFGTHLLKEIDYLLDTLWREVLVFFTLPFAGGLATWLAGALAILAGFGALLLWNDERRQGRRAVMVSFLACLALTYPADILGLYPIGYRWLLYAAPIYWLCIATALDALWTADVALGKVTTALVVANLLPFLPQHDDWNPLLSVPREEMRPVVELLNQQATSGDLIYVSDGGWPAFAHYASQSSLRALRGDPVDLLAGDRELARILEARQDFGSIWLLLAREGLAQRSPAAELEARGFQLVFVAEQPGLRLTRAELADSP